jgi:predicted ATP-grasp superfamily ATP-dependent carboligase
LDFDALVYVANLENHPDSVEDLARGCRLLGNSPNTLRQVRDWRTLRVYCRDAGLSFPATRLPGEDVDLAVRWLRKPVHGGGGYGIRFWDGNRLDAEHFLQAHVVGRAGSAAFVADGQRSVLIGLAEQLIGREELGPQGFAWCGNILPLEIPAAERSKIIDDVAVMVSALTRRFGLRGVNGIDFVVTRTSDGALRPTLVEVNPRYTASMELVEQAYGLNVFSLHAEAMTGRLPDFSLAERLWSQRLSFGKAIVYARRTVTMPETATWVERGRRDIPFPGERIGAGHPVCTVLAEGESRAECWKHLLAKAGEVRREIGDL